MKLKDVFRSSVICKQYLFELVWPKWPKGFRCTTPKCKSKSSWKNKYSSLICKSCNKQYSILSKTDFTKCRIPINLFLKAIWIFCNNSSGVSARSIKKELGLKSYISAWRLLNNIRYHIANSTLNIYDLSGWVELGVAKISSHSGNIDILAASETNVKQFSQIRLLAVDHMGIDKILTFVNNNIKNDSTLQLDDRLNMFDLRNKGYWIRPSNNSSIPRAHVPNIVNIEKRLIKMLNITYGYSVDYSNIQLYLDEFVFRNNVPGTTYERFSALLSTYINDIQDY